MTVSVLRLLKDMEVPADRIFVYGQLGAVHVGAIYGRNAPLASHLMDI